MMHVVKAVFLCFNYVSMFPWTRMSYCLILLCNKSSEAYLCCKNQPLSRIVVAPFQSIDKQILTLQFKFKVILGTQNISFFSLPCEIKSMASCRKPMLSQTDVTCLYFVSPKEVMMVDCKVTVPYKSYFLII